MNENKECGIVEEEGIQGQALSGSPRGLLGMSVDFPVCPVICLLSTLTWIPADASSGVFPKVQGTEESLCNNKKPCISEGNGHCH